MTNRKVGNKAVPPAKRALGNAPGVKPAKARSAAPTLKKKVTARPTSPRPAARTKSAPTRVVPAKAAPAKAGPAKRTLAKAGPPKRALPKAAPAKRPPAPAIRTKAAPAKTAPKPAAAARRPHPAARVAPSPRDDDARRSIQALEQERAELQRLGTQMRAELDSALAEADRLREHLREHVRDLETTQMRPASTPAGPATPGGFDPVADLDEELPAGPDEDLDETAGFFDRMDEIRARRNELDRERNDRELEQSDQPFWMICPKCGDLMEESEGENVKLERCENCGGLYLDRGEVDLILSLCVGPDAYRRLHNIMKF